MNDLVDNNTKPKNIEELYRRILNIVEKIYEESIPNKRVVLVETKNRKIIQKMVLYI